VACQCFSPYSFVCTLNTARRARRAAAKFSRSSYSLARDSSDSAVSRCTSPNLSRSMATTFSAAATASTSLPAVRSSLAAALYRSRSLMGEPLAGRVAAAAAAGRSFVDSPPASRTVRTVPRSAGETASPSREAARASPRARLTVESRFMATPVTRGANHLPPIREPGRPVNRVIEISGSVPQIGHHRPEYPGRSPWSGYPARRGKHAHASVAT
jgi:hypothetical protein